MAERWTRHQALHQAIAVAIGGVLVASIGVYLARQPQGVGSLKAEVSSLRSQAAESALVLNRQQDLGARFLDAHRDQLARDVERTTSRIAGLRVEAQLTAMQRFAQQAGARIESALRARAPASADPTSRELRALVEDLARLEQSLER